MTKENLDKILTPRNFMKSEEVSPDEKKILMDLFAKKGVTTSTFYLRFFQRGFDEWEIIGIKNCKRRFLELTEVAKELSEYVDETHPSIPGNKGYLYVLAQSDEPGVFYKCLKKVKRGICRKFFDYMLDKGMSPATVIKRFNTDDWKPWEEAGVSDILTEYEKYAHM